jgi:hypothetical protein
MEPIAILNRCHRFRGFVYRHAHFSAGNESIEVAVRPRKDSAAVCSRSHLMAPGYDQLAERRFELAPASDALAHRPMNNARSLRRHCELRKSYGFRTFHCLELATLSLTWQVARAGIDPRILLASKTHAALRPVIF